MIDNPRSTQHKNILSHSMHCAFSCTSPNIAKRNGYDGKWATTEASRNDTFQRPQRHAIHQRHVMGLFNPVVY